MTSRSKIDMLRDVAYRLLRAVATLDEPLENLQIVGLQKRVEALETLQARPDHHGAIEPAPPLAQHRAAFHVTGEANHALR